MMNPPHVNSVGKLLLQVHVQGSCILSGIRRVRVLHQKHAERRLLPFDVQQREVRRRSLQPEGTGRSQPHVAPKRVRKYVETSASLQAREFPHAVEGVKSTQLKNEQTVKDDDHDTMTSRSRFRR